MNDEPSLKRKTLNYIKSTASHVKNRLKKVSQQIWRDRVHQCRSNECRYYVKKKDRCRHKRCGCPIAKKAIRESENCPLGFWKQ